MWNPFRRTEVIYHNASGIDREPKAKFLFRLEADFWWPDFHRMVYIMEFGSCEHLVVTATTHAALDKYISRNNLRRNPHLIDFTIIGPDGILERFNPYGNP